MKKNERFPSWMVGNGVTWTLVPSFFQAGLPEDVAFIEAPGSKRGDQVGSYMIVLDGFAEAEVVGLPGGWGWTSLAFGSNEAGWLNLVIFDGRSLADSVMHARGWDNDSGRWREVAPSAKYILGARIDGLDSGTTFGDLLLKASSLPSPSTAEDALVALERSVAVWEIIVNRFGLGNDRSVPEDVRMLMYSDNMQLYSLLEEALFLKHPDFELSRFSPTDTRVSSALSRLSALISVLAPGYDIDLRCREAISSHQKERPAVVGIYRTSGPSRT